MATARVRQVSYIHEKVIEMIRHTGEDIEHANEDHGFDDVRLSLVCLGLIAA